MNILGLEKVECHFSWSPPPHPIEKQEIWGNHIKAGFFNVIIQDIAVHGTND